MTEQPNIVVLVLDTLRAKNVSCYGHTSETTPFIDTLAADGARFSDAYTVSPWTLPAHASLFTGLYPSEHGANAATKHLPAQFDTLAENLQDAGYGTLGVSNNVWLTPERGMDRGFDGFELVWQLFDTPDIAAPTTGNNTTREAYVGALKRVMGGNVLKRVANLVYGLRFRRRRDRAELTNRRIRDTLPDEPFFLFANYMEPHIPYEPPQEYAERFLPDGVSFEEADALPQDPWGYVFGEQEYSERDFEILEALYDAAVAYLDDQVRDLVEYLEELTDRETVVVVTSDHGENIGDHGMMAHQYSLEKTVIHVPLVINGGGFSGERNEQVDLLDVHRTLLEIGGADVPDAARGRDLRETVPDGQSFAQYHEPTPPMDILMERHGIEEGDFDGRQAMDAVIDGETKLVRFADRIELRSNDGEERQQDDESEERRLADALASWKENLSSPGDVTEEDVGGSLKRRLEELGYY